MLSFGRILLLVVALFFFIIAVMVYRGRTDLIHAYHQKRIKDCDKLAYGKAFSKGLFMLGFSCLIAAAGSLVTDDSIVAVVAFVGLAIGFAVLYGVQRKYNGGLF